MPLSFSSGALCALFLSTLAFQPQVDIQQRATREPARQLDNVPRPDIRIDTALVQIPAHVTTAFGASVTTLNRANFHVFEDGVEQTITEFATEDAPISIGLLFDSSGSMQKKMQRSSEAAAAFFKTANSEDEFFLVEFNDRAKLSIPFTANSAEIYQHIAHIKPYGRTSLLDAIHVAMQQMKYAHHLRKAIVILSDGGDNRSRYTGAEIRNAMLESDVQLYAMGIFDPPGDAHKLPIEEVNGPRLLDELSQQTGGRNYPVDNLDDLASISARIGEELRSQYLLGYNSTNPARDGRYRRVTLTVDPPSPQLLKAYYRQGYNAPSN
ncbi:MAG TPA: VWA domain-containing protein [Bryobacteraceae bacterium]|jgi:VWFA-related protein